MNKIMCLKVFLLVIILISSVTYGSNWTSGKLGDFRRFFGADKFEAPTFREPGSKPSMLSNTDYDYSGIGLDLTIDYEKMTKNNYGFNIGLSYASQDIDNSIIKKSKYMLLNTSFVYRINEKFNAYLGFNYPLAIDPQIILTDGSKISFNGKLGLLIGSSFNFNEKGFIWFVLSSNQCSLHLMLKEHNLVSLKKNQFKLQSAMIFSVKSTF